MIRCRFKCDVDDPRPVRWPIKHPYWVTGYDSNDVPIIVAYADNEKEIKLNWPEATDLDSEPATEYNFTSRFAKPDWMK